MRKLFVLAILMLAVWALPAHAQIATSPVVTVPVNFTLGESVSLNVSPASVTLTTSAPSANITLTASWILQSGAHSTGTLYAWMQTMPTGLNNGAIFSTQYNGGAATFCSQPAFSVSGVGKGGFNCGSYALSNNFGTDTNDSATVTLTLNFVDPNHLIAVGSYPGGILDVAFVVA